ncbi:hypothetical protein BG003_000404 [Podila horticola]|nr:hypothetical protein BG003_000404 [Podila horticola]
MTAEDQDLVFCLIKSNPGLRSLALYPFLDLEELLPTLSAAHLPPLEELVMLPPHFLTPCPLRQSAMLPSIAKSFFENLSENIRNIRARLDSDRTMAINSGTDTGTAPCRPHLLLRSFALEGSLSGVEEYLLLRFLQSCGRNLQHIFTPKEEHFAVHSLFQTLAGSAVAIACLENRQPGVPKTFRGSGGGSSVGCCQELEELMITGCEEISSPSFQRILCSAPKLQRLYASYRAFQEWPIYPRLHAADVIGSQWACTALKIFQADIVGVPRPGVSIAYQGQPFDGGSFADSYDTHDIQRRILAQLGALTDLEELNLSQQTYSDATDEIDFTHGISWSTQMYNCDIQVGCLEMSLAGSLDLLSGLKKLKVLDLSNMSHKVGPVVRSWIEEQLSEWGEKHNGSELRDYEDDDLY